MSSITQFACSNLGLEKDKFQSWYWQMSHQITSNEQASAYIDLEAQETAGFDETQVLFRTGITPYYMSLIAKHPEIKALRLQAIPTTRELTDKGGELDPLKEKEHTPVPEVVHVYPDRVAFCVAMLCPIYCRYCYRKRRDLEKGLHFNRQILDRGIDYIAKNPGIRDVLITGGDPFIASDQAIEELVSRLRAIEHVDIIRFGTRTPVTLPFRITENLVNILKKYHPIYVNTHFNHAAEVTKEAIDALRLLADAGIPLGNQSVLLKDVNDSTEALIDLSRALIKNRVKPYYLFHAHLVAGTEHLRVSAKRGQDLIKGMRGKISGYGIPSFIIDTPSGKVPANPNYILGFEGEDVLLEDLHGEIWREKGGAVS